MKHLSNISELLTLDGAYNKDGRNLLPEDISLIENASLIYDENEIIWIGPSQDVPPEYKSLETLDLSGHCLTPEIVDSHTHLVFAGNRSAEYSMRLNGADYQEIAKSGGGILSTSKATKEASDSELLESAKERIEKIYSYGVGSVEIKSGYALNYEDEMRCSKIIKELKDHFSPRVNIYNTFLAAHAVPKDFDSSTSYLTKVCIPLMQDLAKDNIIDIVDIFHETGYFTLEDTKLLFDEATKLKLKLKIHADEFGDNGGATIASEFDALSADHLLCTGNDGIKSLANSKTVATLLPGTGWFLGKPQAKGRLMQDEGCRVALASDFNPGSCHFDNLLQIASMAAPMYPLNMTEMWAAITLNASSSLGANDQGAIVKGLAPRFSVFKCSKVSDITYSWGKNLCDRSFNL